MTGSAVARCPGCGAEPVAESKFCGVCGARLRAACPACGHANPAGHKFCSECGAALGPAAPAPAGEPRAAAPAFADPLAAAGPSSAFREVAPATYTPKHLAEKILTSKGALEGERKSVTVMFSDVSGFTAMSERLGPREGPAIMDRAFEVILTAG